MGGARSLMSVKRMATRLLAESPSRKAIEAGQLPHAGALGLLCQLVLTNRGHQQRLIDVVRGDPGRAKNRRLYSAQSDIPAKATVGMWSGDRPSRLASPSRERPGEPQPWSADAVVIVVWGHSPFSVRDRGASNSPSYQRALAQAYTGPAHESIE